MVKTIFYVCPECKKHGAMGLMFTYNMDDDGVCPMDGARLKVVR